MNMCKCRGVGKPLVTLRRRAFGVCSGPNGEGRLELIPVPLRAGHLFPDLALNDELTSRSRERSAAIAKVASIRYTNPWYN